MAQPFLDDLRALIGGLEGLGEIACKHFFSGAAAYVSGQIFMSLSPVGLALKLPQDQCQALLDRGATPLRYFPKSPIKRGYVVLPAPMVADLPSLKHLVTQAIACARNAQP
ncbi:MAG: TfoX/Sxy family protein [Alphaproteobacteria bacterium]